MLEDDARFDWDFESKDEFIGAQNPSREESYTNALDNAQEEYADSDSDFNELLHLIRTINESYSEIDDTPIGIEAKEIDNYTERSDGLSVVGSLSEIADATSLFELGILSSRALTNLERGGITTAGDLRKADKRSLGKIRGIGGKTLDKIIDLRRSLGSFSRTQRPTSSNDKVSPDESETRSIERYPWSINAFDDLSAINLNTHIERKLRDLGVATIYDLVTEIDTLPLESDIAIQLKEVLKAYSAPLNPDLNSQSRKLLCTYYGAGSLAFDATGALILIPGIAKDKLPSASRFDDYPIERVQELGTRVRHALQANGITTVRELAKLSDSELSSLPNFGQKSLYEVHTFLEENGLRQHAPIQDAPSIPVNLNDYPIEEVKELGTRARHTLQANGITTVRELAKLSDSELSSLPHFGQKSLYEVHSFLEENGLRQYAQVRDSQSIPASFAHYPLDNLTELSSETINTLRAEGITTVGALAQKSDAELLSIWWFGPKSLNEVHSLFEHLELQYSGVTHAESEASNGNKNDSTIIETDESDFIDDVSFEGLVNSFSANSIERARESIRRLKSLGVPIVETSFYLTILPEFELLDTLESDLAIEKVVNNILESETYIPYLLRAIELKISSYKGTNFVWKLPPGKAWDRAAKTYAEKYPASVAFEEKNRTIVSHKLTFAQWVDSLPDACSRLLKARMSGLTLQQIGDLEGLTRERIRQKISRAFKRIPELEEDRLLRPFIEYRWTPEMFKGVFDVDDGAYWYLEYISKGVEKPEIAQPIEMALTDPILTATERDRLKLELEIAERANTIDIEGDRIEINRKDIIHRLFVTHAVDGWLSFEKLIDLYDQVLSDNGLTGKRRLAFKSPRNFYSYLDRDSSILVVPYPTGRMPKHGNLKWFPPEELDLWPLITVLERFAEANIECSCASFFDKMKAGALRSYSKADYEEAVSIIQDLNITDEYMLHRILRRYADFIMGLKFGRSPYIRFGVTDRQEQILDLIHKNPGITASSLAQSYERLYGVRPEVFIGSYSPSISIYNRGGHYYPDVENESLNVDETQYLIDKLESLPHPYYPLSLLREDFRSRFGVGAGRRVNAHTLGALEQPYVIEDRLVVRDDFDLTDYFTHLIDNTDSFAVGDMGFESEVFANRKFRDVLYSRLSSMDIIGYGNRQYVALRHLMAEDSSINKDILIDFAHKVMTLVVPDIPFTIQQLLNEGLKHPADDFRRKHGYPVQFLESTLQSMSNHAGLRRTYYNGQTVFLKTVANKGSFNMFDFFAYIVNTRGGISESDLAELLSEQYGVRITEKELSKRLAIGGKFRYDEDARYVYPLSTR